MSTKIKTKPPTYHRPLPCVIIAVDPARTSGWATFLDGRPVSWGKVDAADVETIERILRAARELAGHHGIPVAIVGESWNAGGRRGIKTWQGMGAAWGSWKFAAERLGFVARRIMRVSTSTWRAAFKISRRPKGAPDSWHKEQAVTLARQRLGVSLEAGDHDVAEALLIGLWASHAHAVADRIPKRAMMRWLVERAA